MQEIILYTIDCPQCIILQRKLNAKEIRYFVVKNLEEMAESGIDVQKVSFPILKVNGELMTMSEANAWVNNYTEGD